MERKYSRSTTNSSKEHKSPEILDHSNQQVEFDKSLQLDDRKSLDNDGNDTQHPKLTHSTHMNQLAQNQVNAMRKCSLVDNVGISDQVRTEVIVSDIPSQHKHSARIEDAIAAGDTLQPPHLLTPTTDPIHGSSTGTTATPIVPQAR